MNRTMIRSLTMIAASLVSSAAFAHPGHELYTAGLADGLLHPLLSLDHLLTMLLVGVWAAQLGGKARWMLPLSFVTVMALGAGLSIADVVLPQIEAGIASSMLIMLLLAVSALRLSPTPALLLTGLFALFHGAAHGLELPALAQPAMFALGFLSSTAALLASGFVLQSLAGDASAHRSAILCRRVKPMRSLGPMSARDCRPT